MDYTYAELLTREQLLEILVERQLNIPNIEEMPQRELVRIYKSFALPLAQRQNLRNNKKKSKDTFPFTQPDYVPLINNVQCINGLSMDVDESEHILLPSNKANINNSTLSKIIISSEKRTRDYKHLNPMTDELLSMAAKRIKIEWS